MFFFPPPPCSSFLPKRFLNSLFAHHFPMQNADGKWFSTAQAVTLQQCFALFIVVHKSTCFYPKLLIIKGKICKKLFWLCLRNVSLYWWLILYSVTLKVVCLEFAPLRLNNCVSVYGVCARVIRAICCCPFIGHTWLLESSYNSRSPRIKLDVLWAGNLGIIRLRTMWKCREVLDFWEKRLLRFWQTCLGGHSRQRTRFYIWQMIQNSKLHLCGKSCEIWLAGPTKG